MILLEFCIVRVLFFFIKWSGWNCMCWIMIWWVFMVVLVFVMIMLFGEVWLVRVILGWDIFNLFFNIIILEILKIIKCGKGCFIVYWRLFFIGFLVLLVSVFIMIICFLFFFWVYLLKFNVSGKVRGVLVVLKLFEYVIIFNSKNR